MVRLHLPGLVMQRLRLKTGSLFRWLKWSITRSWLWENICLEWFCLNFIVKAHFLVRLLCRLESKTISDTWACCFVGRVGLVHSGLVPEIYTFFIWLGISSCGKGKVVVYWFLSALSTLLMNVFNAFNVCSGWWFKGWLQALAMAMLWVILLITGLSYSAGKVVRISMFSALVWHWFPLFAFS